MNTKQQSLSVIFASIILVLLFYSCQKKEDYKEVNTKKSVFLTGEVIPDSHFLGDQKCKECHQNEFKKWKGSHHDKAMQIADSATVLANFNNKKFTSQGVTSHFFKKGKDFYVNTDGPDGKNHDYKIIYVFGITPLQQYIVQFPDGHYQCLRTAWDSVKNKWFDLYPDFKVVHSEWLHWSRGGLNWNNMCSDCHSTNVRKNYDVKTHSYNTKFAIINVNCEACHGPGKQHVTDVDKMGENYVSNGSFQMTSETEPKELVDKCARCHMRREQYSETFNFEGTMLDHYYPQLLEERLYQADGQILDEVYVYGSFTQSKMYQNDVTCTNCHDAHTLKLKFDGNKLCAQCHVPETYDTPKHHAHPLNTESSKCVSCHMPGRVYMGNDFRPDHSFRVPRPDLSVKYGTPNACSGCHKDKDDVWAAASFTKLYGAVDSVHYSEKLAPGITMQPNAHLGLIELMNEKHQPEIVRASAVKALSNYDVDSFIDEFTKLLKDESAIVRGASVDVLNLINNTDYTAYFLPLLEDPKRSVRIKAFFGLGTLDASSIPKVYQESYQKVKNEFWTHINTNSDFVGTRMKKGDYLIKQGKLFEAIKSYESALDIDDINNQIRVNLATLYYNTQQFDKAETTYKEIIKFQPDYGPVYYSLSLLYAELNRVDGAIEQLKKAQKLMPENIRVYYNLGLLYDKKQDFKQAEKTIITGLKVDNTNESLLYVLAYIYGKSNQKEKAKNIVKKLIDLYPNNQQYRVFLSQL
ncbi:MULTISPECIES: tetratricopeptide repeat protein [Polaribacter]|uniref:tetratricopeptide repeat protein n=1 Tax=Polaribacter TaxID=52959 RepID=UPI0026E1A449|nr:tetratricopeptide repeat protein [Polaribacter sp. 1_MG-2023]MDO6739668.1 tetratricopeptide repeat protein [Polaribacter sp. 1_MG-2023]